MLSMPFRLYLLRCNHLNWLRCWYFGRQGIKQTVETLGIESFDQTRVPLDLLVLTYPTLLAP